MPPAINRPNVSSHEPICGGASGVAKIRAPATDPVMLLGDIGEIEELRERARDGKRFLDGHLLEQPRQRGEVGVAAAARFLRQRADALDPI